MMKLTMDDITPEVENAVNAYLLARAYAETMRESVDKVYAAVLVDIPMFDDIKLGVRYEPTGERITNHNLLYLSSDEDACKRVYAEVDKQLRADGAKSADMPAEHCPALVAENIQHEAEWAILDAAAVMLGLEFDGKELNHRLLCLGLEKQKQFIDLVVKLVVNRPGFKAPKIPVAA
jgi:hypothetical protein